MADIDAYLEHPEPYQQVEGTLRVAGWVFSRHADIREVVVRISGCAHRAARYGLERADVAAAYPGEPRACRPGFEVYIDVSSLSRGPAEFDVVARLDGGTDAVVASRRIVLVSADHQAALLSRRRRGFIGAAAALAADAIRERRLPLSPRAWVQSLAQLRRVREAPWTREALRPDGSDYQRLADADVLRHFLESGARLRFAPGEPPHLAIVLVLFNRAALTLRCLRSLASVRSVPLELVIVDNASSDETVQLLQRIEGAVVVRNQTNEGFLAGANRGVGVAQAPFLLLLNNDTEALPGSIEAALTTLRTSETIGAVGGRLVATPGGHLQEAGSMVFGDGSCAGYGRDDDPGAPMYMFQRDVDFCSGAFLLTSRSLFNRLGGFDARFSPAYYEDADFCARVWESGRRVVYEPRAVVLHAEFGSASSRASALELQAARRVTFLEKHGGWLSQRPERTAGAELLLRDRRKYAQRILFFDDRVPHSRLGAGFGRSAAIVRSLVELGHFVTLYPLVVTGAEWPAAYDEIPRTVEVMTGWGTDRLSRFMRDRRAYYDCVIVSRPPNMRMLRDVFPTEADWLADAALVYDAEAIWALRDIGRRRVAGEALDEIETSGLIKQELELAAGADVVFCASADERHRFEAAGYPCVRTLGHALETIPSTTPFDRRDALLFVGSFTDDSPNIDAVTWFVQHVAPILRERIGAAFSLVIAGLGSDSLSQLQGPGVQILGAVDDLRPLYERARLFVAPTRFAAGLPLKVIEAASQGVPVVCTPLLADQLQWRDGDELLVADTAASFAMACERLWMRDDLWQRLRGVALDRVIRDYSSLTFREALREGLAAASHTKLAGPRNPLRQ